MTHMQTANVSWSLTSFFNTNTAISETKGQSGMESYPFPVKEG